MSYPPGFDVNRLDNSSVPRPNNAAQMPNNSYHVPLDPFQAQSYGGIPAPITYPNSNHSVRPPNMFFPPIDFSVPPPNIPQMNVSRPIVNDLKNHCRTLNLFDIRWSL